MGDQFRTSQHVAGREGNIALAHTLYGQPTVSHARADLTGNPNIGRAVDSTAPYVPPKRRVRDSPDKELCAEDGCNAFPSKGKPYCTGHARTHGLSPSCAKQGCGAAPKGEGIYCHWHQPQPVVTEDDLFDGDAD